MTHSDKDIWHVWGADQTILNRQAFSSKNRVTQCNPVHKATKPAVMCTPGCLTEKSPQKKKQEIANYGAVISQFFMITFRLHTQIWGHSAKYEQTAVLHAKSNKTIEVFSIIAERSGNKLKYKYKAFVSPAKSCQRQEQV